MTSAGDLLHRLRLEQRDPTQNSLREQSKSWVEVVTLWGRAYPLRGREFFDAAQQQSEITMRFRLRHRGGITTKMRVVWLLEGGGAPYDIQSVLPVDGRREWLDLMCKNGIRDGRDPA